MYVLVVLFIFYVNDSIIIHWLCALFLWVKLKMVKQILDPMALQALMIRPCHLLVPQQIKSFLDIYNCDNFALIS